MSVASCLMIFLLCCLSLHGYNARSLAATDKQEKKPQMSYQSDFQKEISVAREVESSFSSNKRVTKVKSIERAVSNDAAHEKLNKNGKPEKNLVKKDAIARKTSDYGDQNVSAGSVSWTVPKQKRGVKHPGFNLDYSPPKTHPPSHN